MNVPEMLMSNQFDNKIAALIATHGSVTISQFIDLCLADREYGYYHNILPFGRDGDFITAPEISQMFGEILAIWALSSWQQLGKSEAFTFCEIGPGRGTLMDDMLRTLAKLSPDFLKSTDIILIETSQRLRGQIAEKLKSHQIAFSFLDTINDLPSLPIIAIANEWLDCLPIHQYVRGSSGWHERMVTVDEKKKLRFSLSPVTIAPPLTAHLPLNLLKNVQKGTIIEISPTREAVIEQLSQHILDHNGAALLIDYGSQTSGFGDTLQAMSKHNFQDPLTNPGQHDLTSHVDFFALSNCAKKVGCSSPCLTQGEFLTALGIKQRATQLMQGKDTCQQQKIDQELERLIGNANPFSKNMKASQGMGELFQVLLIARPGSSIPPFI